MKVCTVCRLEKTPEEFYKNRSRRGGTQDRCKECSKERSRSHYKQNKDVYLFSNLKRKKANAEWLRQYKESNPCADCKNQYPYYVMDFDHLKDKKTNVSKLVSTSKLALLEEIEKCELVCANCHRIRTHQRRNAE